MESANCHRTLAKIILLGLKPYFYNLQELHFVVVKSSNLLFYPQMCSNIDPIAHREARPEAYLNELLGVFHLLEASLVLHWLQQPPPEPPRAL
jgi:hypothetical protein